MAAHRSPLVLVALLAAGAIVSTVTPRASRADEPLPALEPARVPVPVVEILESLDRPELGKGWLDVHLDRVRFHKKYGLTYTHSMQGDEKSLRLTVRGPVLGKALSSHRRIGLSFEIEF